MVIKFLSFDEALIMGMNLEKEGLKFYTEIAKNSNDKPTKDIFLTLAKDEKEHYELFKTILKKNSGATFINEQLNNDITLYLQSLIDTGIFSDLKKRLEKKSKNLTSLDAISIGIQAEKDSILFYQEALQISRNPSGKKIFGYLLAEEKKHLVILWDRFIKILKK